MLIERGYDSRESITNKKIDLEKRENLGKVLQRMEINQFIRFGVGERKQDISKQSSVLGETFEALIAAVHIDAGSYEATKKLVIQLFTKQTPSNSPQNVVFKPAEDDDLDADQKLWMRFNSCGNCIHRDICARMMNCMFDS